MALRSNALFGMNSQADLLLAVVGLRRVDVERFRDVRIDGESIAVYSRTGGGNRESYPQEVMRHRPEWKASEDDDYDSTYCNDFLAIPAEYLEDTEGLADVLTHGIRPEFGRHLAVTLRLTCTPH